MVFGPLLSNGRQRVGAFKENARVETVLLNIRMQWNAGTACVSECVLKTLPCRGLRVGPSKAPSAAGNSMTGSERPSPEPFLKKEASPAVLGGERIPEMLWSLQMPLIIGLGGSQLYSRGEFQE